MAPENMYKNRVYFTLLPFCLGFCWAGHMGWLFMGLAFCGYVKGNKICHVSKGNSLFDVVPRYDGSLGPSG